jgi:hypothetical protein
MVKGTAQLSVELGKEIQKFQSLLNWSEITQDPRFIEGLSSEQIKKIGIDDFLTKYIDIRPLKPCSLSNCHAKQGTG